MIPSRDDAAARAAGFASFAILANQAGGRAARDALFLAEFQASALPRLYAISAILALVAVLVGTRPLARFGPHRLATVAFAVTAVLQFVLGQLADVSPDVASIAYYFLLAVSGSAFVSWFWASVSERFDPRTAKRKFAGIAGAGTLGGLAGGLFASATAGTLSIGTVISVLAFLPAVAAIFCARVGAGARESSATTLAPGAAFDAFKSPVLRLLAALVAAVAMSALLVDYVFKSRAQAVFPDGADLLRFFGAVSAAASILTLVAQRYIARPLLARAGLAPTAAALPAATALFGFGAILVPGLGPVAALRAIESALRGSVFRTSYELFYTPMSRAVTRGGKALVDVGFDRLGELAGAIAIQFVLAASGATAGTTLLGLAVFLALGALALAPRLHRGYVKALEDRLHDRTASFDPGSIEDMTTRSTVLRTLGGDETMSMGDMRELFQSMRDKAATGEESGGSGAGGDATIADSEQADAALAKLAALRSGDPIRVKTALGTQEVMDAILVPQAIRLLAVDAVAADAGRALVLGVEGWTGQLADALLDGREEVAVRRRVPRLLARADNDRAIDALLEGLSDVNFEVRLRCADALARIRERRGRTATIDAAALLAAARRETNATRVIGDGGPLIDAARFVVKLVALASPDAEVAAALDCLERGDARRRGTALEYLETLLPATDRGPVVGFVERAFVTRGERAAAEDAEVAKSHETVRVSLEEVRRARGGGGTARVS